MRERRRAIEIYGSASGVEATFLPFVSVLDDLQQNVSLISPGEPGMSVAIVRIERDGSLELCTRLRVACRGIAMQVRQAAENVLPRGQVLRGPRRRPFQLRLLDFRLDDGDDPPGDLVLYVEDIFDRAVEPIGP